MGFNSQVFFLLITERKRIFLDNFINSLKSAKFVRVIYTFQMKLPISTKAGKKKKVILFPGKMILDDFSTILQKSYWWQIKERVELKKIVYYS